MSKRPHLSFNSYWISISVANTATFRVSICILAARTGCMKAKLHQCFMLKHIEVLLHAVSFCSLVCRYWYVRITTWRVFSADWELKDLKNGVDSSPCLLLPVYFGALQIADSVKMTNAVGVWQCVEVCGTLPVAS